MISSPIAPPVRSPRSSARALMLVLSLPTLLACTSSSKGVGPSPPKPGDRVLAISMNPRQEPPATAADFLAAFDLAHGAGARAGLTSGRALAWDCAAGSGQATMSLLPYFDRIVAYAEVRRVLVPDGIIAMWRYGLHRISNREIDNAIAFPWWGDEQCQRRVTWPLALRVGSVR